MSSFACVECPWGNAREETEDFCSRRRAAGRDEPEAADAGAPRRVDGQTAGAAGAHRAGRRHRQARLEPACSVVIQAVCWTQERDQAQ